jgi:sec-independent protein translocase protein TatA
VVDHVRHLESCFRSFDAGVGIVDRIAIKERQMGSMSIMHWLIVVAVVLLLFGRGKIPELMGDVANGIKSFKKGMQDDEPDGKKPSERKPSESESAQIGVDHQLSAPVARSAHRSDSLA